MSYTTKVRPNVDNAERYQVIHMSHPGPEYWKVLGHLIGYLKSKETKGIIIRKPKVLIYVILCDLNYATNKDTRKSVGFLVATIGGTLLPCSSKTQKPVTVSSKEAEYM